MKLSSIPQLFRNMNRSLEILGILSKYRLAGWIDRFDLDIARGVFKGSGGEELSSLEFETRVRLALIELGPTFIKFGQMLSTRPDMIGQQMALELSRLQSDVPADPPEQVRELVESELGQRIEELFDEFNDVALASASIGQVHQAKLKTGEPVAVKVQHHGIREKVLVDLEILTGLAELLEQVPEFQNYRPRQTAAEFQRALRRELEFGREERNLHQFAMNFQDDPTVRVPTVYPELSTGKVLTMEFLDGVKIADVETLRDMAVDLDEVARRGAGAFLEMIFEHGFYHADPHPGNLLVLPGNVVGIIDFGMVGRVDETMRDNIQEIVLAIAQADVDHLADVITRIGSAPPDLDSANLRGDLSEFVSQYAGQEMNRLDVGRALTDMTEIIRNYHILLPSGMAMLIKVLVVLEGTARALSPSVKLMELIEPYHKKLLWRRFSPARQMLKLRRLYCEWEALGATLPRNLIDILQQIQSGRFDVHLDHRNLEPSVNRLVLGMLASALYLGSSWMLSNKVPPVINIGFETSLLGMLGCLVSMGMGLRLLWAIRKSGRLDRSG
ncbi:MAG: AarF/ABC1/UbiB kinase family protein [Planctomycetales bacterium]